VHLFVVISYRCDSCVLQVIPPSEKEIAKHISGNR
jgi:hypothetical protein